MSESNADRFINAFVNIEKYMQERIGPLASMNFKDNLRELEATDPMIRREYAALRFFADLRNAIQHNDRLQGIAIADPRLDAVLKIEKLAQELEKPKRVLNVMAHQPQVFGEDERLLNIMQHMAEKDYSQVIVQTGSGRVLFTTNDIAMWIGERARGEDGLVDLDDVPIGAVSRLEETVFVSSTQTAYDLPDILRKQKEPVFAVLVTHSGKPTEKVIGIVTPWDVIEHLDE